MYSFVVLVVVVVVVLVVEADLDSPVLTAGDVDDPGAALCSLHEGQEEPGEEEVGQIVDPQLVLEAVLCSPVRRVADTTAVDQDVHPGLRLQHPGSQLSDGVEGGELALFHLELPLALFLI